MNLANEILTKKELERYSLTNAISRGNADIIGPGATIRKRESSLETEVSDTLRSKFTGLGYDPDGILIPFEAFGAITNRALNASTFSGGGALVGEVKTLPDQFPFPMSVVRRAGAQDITGLSTDGITGMGSFAVPIVSASDEAQWFSETEGTASSGESTVGIRIATPKRLQTTRKVSRQLLNQMRNSEEFMALLISKSLSAGLDRAALAGQGGKSPLGLLYTPLVGVQSLGGAAPTLAALCGCEGQVIAGNFNQENGSWIISPNTRTKAKQVQKWTNASVGLLETVGGSDFLNGHPAYSTNYMPDNLGAGAAYGSAIFGDFSKLSIVTWGAIQLVRDPYTGATAGREEWTITIFADAICQREQAFARLTDIATV